MPTFHTTFEERNPMAQMLGRVSADRTVKVDKNSLIVSLQDNLRKHEDIYAEAVEGWKAATVAWLTALEDAAKKQAAEFAGGKISKVDTKALFNHPPERPKNQKKAYKAAIKMFEWETKDKVTLSVEEFNAYVLDEWPWRRDTLMSNARYSKSATRALSMLDDE
jgi:hypothetical protein